MPLMTFQFICLRTHQYESYYNHTYSPDQSSLTWTLDYDKTSDFRDCVGHWHVTPAPDHTATSTYDDDNNNRAITRVYYACDIKMNGNPPKAIMNYISKAALKQATAWVKRESEAHPDETIPAEYGGAATKQQVVHEKEYVPVGAETRRGFWGRR
jgi:hypothetical protein